MLYEGIELGSDLRVIECPKCNNEEFSKDAEFCRICGSRSYNRCEGVWDEREDLLIKHENPGNARFCETCGEPTYFLTGGFLDPWDKIQEDSDQRTEGVSKTTDSDDDDLPF